MFLRHSAIKKTLIQVCSTSSLYISEEIFLAGQRYQSNLMLVFLIWPDPHQAAVAPWAPVSQHAVIGTGQLACPRPQRHVLWVTQVVLHSLRGPIHSVEHAPLNTGVGVTVSSTVF